MIDATLNAPGGALWIFKGTSYWLMDLASGQLRRGPFPLSEWAAQEGGLPGDFAAGIDAACWAGPAFPNTYYFFRGRQYLRLDHPAFEVGQAAAQVASGAFERALQVVEGGSIHGVWCVEGEKPQLEHAPQAAVHGMSFDDGGAVYFFDGMRCMRHNLLDGTLVGSPDTTSFDRWHFPRHGGPVDLAFWDTRDGNKNLILVSGTRCARYDELTDTPHPALPLDQAFPALWQLAGLSGQYLAIRREDLAVVGVRWTGLSPAGSNELEATGDDARLVVTFPPQSVGEQVADVADIDGTPQFFASPQPRFKAVATPSQLALSLPRGARVGLALPLLFEAMQRAAVHAGLPSKGQMHTLLDMPSGLLWWPRATAGGELGLQPVLAAPDDATAAWPLWRMRLGDRTNAADADAGLRMQTWAALPDPKTQLPAPPRMSLLEDQRRLIVERANAGPLPTVAQLQFSTAGADLRASAAWPDAIWMHEMDQGRDQFVYFKRSGRLFPFGHRARLTVVTTRELIGPLPPSPAPVPAPAPVPVPPHPHGPPFPPLPHPPMFHPPLPLPPMASNAAVPLDALRMASSPNAAAGLVQRSVLTVENPVRSTVDASGAPFRGFPFDAAVLLDTVYEGVDSVTDDPWLHVQGGDVKRFPVRLEHPDGHLTLSLPLAFVPDGEPFDETQAAQLWAAEAAEVKLPGTLIDMVRMQPQRKPNDRVELHAIRWSPQAQADEPWLPCIDTFDAVLPSLRAMNLGIDQPRTMRFAKDGDTRAPMRLADGQEIAVDLAAKAGRSGGLMTPRYAVNAVSRTLGPIAETALDGLTQQALNSFKDSRLLGVPLSALIDEAMAAATQAPMLEPLMNDTRVVGGKMTWSVPLKSVGPFKVVARKTRLNLKATVDAAGSDVTCTLNDVSYQLPGGLLTIDFGSIVWRQPPSQPASLDLVGVQLAFGGEMGLFKDLLDRAMKLIGAPGGMRVRKMTSSVVASWELPIPEASCVSFTVRGVALRMAVEVPLDDRPVSASLAFSSREQPFSLTVMGLGGGGHIALTFGGTDLGFEASIEFGALVALNLGVVSAEVHAFGGFAFERVNGGVRVAVYIRIGGAVNLLGLVTIAVELLVQLTYDERENSLTGEASIVVEVDLTFYSHTFSLSSGQWTLRGGSGPERKALSDAASVRERWRLYQECFA